MSGNLPKKRELSGRVLNKRWNVGAKHALYHRDGRWYNNLRAFPGALFDPHGFVVFETEEEYRTSKHVSVTQETNVTNGISSLPRYVSAMKETQRQLEPKLGK